MDTDYNVFTVGVSEGVGVGVKGTVLLTTADRKQKVTGEPSP